MSKPSEFVFNHLVLPLWEHYKYPSFRKHLDSLQNAWDYKPSELARLQHKKLLRLVIHACTNVPYYRELGLSMSLIKSTTSTQELLSLFPILTRAELTKYNQNLISETHSLRSLTSGSSSGSTGSPVRFYKDKHAESVSKSALYFGWMQSGFKFGQKSITVWGNRKTVSEIWTTKASRTKALLFRQHRIAACNLISTDTISAAISEIHSVLPRFMDGYTNALFLLAREWLSRGYDNLGCTAVFTTAESLLDSQRSVIEAAFGPVFDQYGCSEINGIAFQCSICNNYHIISPHIIAEFKSPSKDGSCPLIVTDLDNYAMPFIKYQIGDSVFPSDNKCSATNWPSITSISGRISDTIILNSKIIINPISFFGDTLGRALSNYLNCSVDHQTEWDGKSFNISIVSGKFKHINLSELTDYMYKVWENDRIPVSFKIVSFIQPGKNGKRNYFLNNARKKIL